MLSICDRAVPQAAPATPQPQPQMKRPSNRILASAPTICVPMAKAGRPSARTQKFATKATMPKGTPIRMIFMYSRAWGSSSSPAPLMRRRRSTFTNPRTVNSPPKSAEAKRTLPRTSSALGVSLSPSAAEISVTEPTPSSSPSAMTKTIKG